jgi:hypothetical protein
MIGENSLDDINTTSTATRLPLKEEGFNGSHVVSAVARVDEIVLLVQYPFNRFLGVYMPMLSMIRLEVVVGKSTYFSTRENTTVHYWGSVAGAPRGGLGDRGTLPSTTALGLNMLLAPWESRHPTLARSPKKHTLFAIVIIYRD